MDLVDLIVEKRDTIKQTCAKYGATAVRVFGSCARDDYDGKSDIDVLVQLPANLDVFEWTGRLSSASAQNWKYKKRLAWSGSNASMMKIRNVQ